MEHKNLKAALKMLEKKRENLFLKIQLLFDRSKDVSTEAKLKEFKIRFAGLEELKSNFEKIVDEWNSVNLELNADFTPDFQVLNSFSDLYLEIKYIAQELGQEIQDPAEVRPMEARPRLPKLDLISFDGDPLKWPLFHQTFKSLIHDNPNFDDTTKIYYLLGLLKGKASTVSAGIVPSASNYQVLWKALLDKYDDRRLLAVTYLKQMLEFKPLQTETVASLNNFLERVDSSIHALLKLDIPNLGDFIIATICLSKLDSQTRLAFEKSLCKDKIPTFECLSSFVKSQVKILSHTGYSTLNQSTKRLVSSEVTHSFAVQKQCLKFADKYCKSCNSTAHWLHKCPRFLALSQTERKDFVNRHSLCFNCLKSGHGLKTCSSSFSCNICRRRHHSLLHSVEEPTSHKDATSKEETQVSLMSTEGVPGSYRPSYTVALATAVVLAHSASGKKHRMRILVDSASQCHLITKNFLKKLGLKTQKIDATVSGIGSSVQTIRSQTEFRFTSRVQPYKEYKVSALVIDKITNELPSSEIDRRIADQLKTFRLADDTFATSGPVDGVVGAELVSDLLGPKILLGPGLPAAIDSPLGVIIIGKFPANNNVHHFLSYHCETSEISSLIQKFWEVEEINSVSREDPEASKCEQIFTKFLSRSVDGRYTVPLPFRNYPPVLGESYQSTLRRFLSLERKLDQNEHFKSAYREVMQDYIDQDHMRLAGDQTSTSVGFFIPHHGVFKPDSTSTPLRVVFDASAKSSNGQSLNDVLFTGAKLQNDLFTLLLQFRLFAIALTADVRQMYRQIGLLPDHRKYQRVLWRAHKNEPIRIYELSTVAFGVKSSPFLALRTVQQLAADEAQQFPIAADRVKRDLYMDDFICSVEDDTAALHLYEQWLGLFKAGGFQLTKWASNSSILMEHVLADIRRSDNVKFETDFLKVLGLQWLPSRDQLTFCAHIISNLVTKRAVLSTIARIWDPLGLLSPVTLWAKILMQSLWQMKIDWDDELPEPLRRTWSSFLEELPGLEHFSVPRHIGVQQMYRHILVGFSDASEKAFAAVVYLRIEDPNSERPVKTNLICAKSKVAPLKTISIPRLELCAALLLAKLLEVVVQTYSSRCSIDQLYACSDSMVVINWLNGSPHRWKTFVSTRVTKIQERIPSDRWFHVSGMDNPADYASRGLTPSQLTENTLWTSGPRWLLHAEDSWPLRMVESINSIEADQEKRPETCLVGMNESSPILDLIHRCGSWNKLLRATVYVLRFGRVLAREKTILTQQLNVAESVLIKVLQRHHFQPIREALETGKSLPKSIRGLNPFIEHDIIRVGGRLSMATLQYEHRHPVLLPKSSPFTILLVDHFHKVNLHAGPNNLLALLRQRFWIIGARSVVRQRVQSCNTCFRNRPVFRTPMMADLPLPRVTEVKPFYHTGVDYGGPFLITLSKHRGIKSQKAYICLFVCMATRALHVECASSLSTDTFLGALRRFLSRRGPCDTLYSDQGTNFVGAKNHLDDLTEFLQSKSLQSGIEEELTSRRIRWKLNPPSAPHFGGLWEAGIKSVKYHLTRVVGNQILTFEEFTTVLCQIEAVLNSRPLCWLSTDPSEPSVLTPSHFLTFLPLLGLPERYTETPTLSHLDRWRLVQQLVHSFWNRWRLEYLSTLQCRMKWNTDVCPIKVGQIVLVHMDNTPPLKWPLGVIQEVYPGQDGKIRVTLVKTQTGLLKRPASKLAPLPNQ